MQLPLIAIAPYKFLPIHLVLHLVLVDNLLVDLLGYLTHGKLAAGFQTLMQSHLVSVLLAAQIVDECKDFVDTLFLSDSTQLLTDAALRLSTRAILQFCCRDW